MTGDTVGLLPTYAHVEHTAGVRHSMSEDLGFRAAAGDMEPGTENKRICHLLCADMCQQLVIQSSMTQHAQDHIISITFC